MLLAVFVFLSFRSAHSKEGLSLKNY